MAKKSLIAKSQRKPKYKVRIKLSSFGFTFNNIIEVNRISNTPQSVRQLFIRFGKITAEMIANHEPRLRCISSVISSQWA